MKIIQIILFVTLFFLGCTNQNTISDTGGSTETVGMVYLVDGTPAESVTVEFIPVDYSGIEPNSFKKSFTDVDGRFDFDSISNGHYNLSYALGNLMAFRKSVIIENGSCTEIINDTVRNFGSIKGVVKLKEEHDNKEVFLILKGTNRYTQVYDSMGNFLLDSVAEGTYEVTVLTSYNYYQSKDTVFDFYSDLKDTLTDTIFLTYEGIDIPDSIWFEYNPYIQKACLLWNSVDTTNFGGFQICRKEYESSENYSVLKSFINDTFYVDPNEETSIKQGCKYLYRISALDKYGASGKFSEPVIVSYDAAFKETLNVFVNGLNNAKLGGVVSDGEGNIFVVCSDTSALYKLSEETMNIVDTYPLPDNCIPYDITILDNKSLMIAGDVGCYNIKRDGSFLYRYSVYSTDIVTIDSTFLYYTTSSEFYLSPDMIVKLNVLNGVRDTLFNGDLNVITSFGVEDEYLYVVRNSYGTVFVDRINMGVNKKETLFSVNGNTGYSDLIVDDSTLTLLNGNALLKMQKCNWDLESRFSLKEKSCSIVKGDDNNLIVLNNSGCISTVREVENFKHTLKNKR